MTAGTTWSRKSNGADDAQLDFHGAENRLPEDGVPFHGLTWQTDALRIDLENGCRAAILKSRSPSCGKGCIYNGQFTGELVPGNGVTTDLLLHHGIEVLTEEEYLTRLTEG